MSFCENNHNKLPPKKTKKIELNREGKNMRKIGKKKKETDAIDEVEELLKLTQEDLLLKLTVNSNTNSKSKFVPESSSQTNNAIHPDLDRRFQALRSKPSNPKIEKVDDKDLFARFAALKGTDPTTTTTTTSIVKNDIEDEDEEDEVSKIINWAIDAARLDPSPSSDIDDIDDNETDSSDDDDDDCSRKVDRKKKPLKK